MSDVPNEAKAEAFPSRPGEISALASANAPIIVFDGGPFMGARDGIGTLTLSSTRNIGSNGLDVVTDRVLVAHVKGGLEAFRMLERNAKAVIEMLEDQERRRVSDARAYEIMCEALPPEPLPLKN